MEETNQNLKEEMEKLYDNDKIYTNNINRQTEEAGIFVKLLQSDIQSISDEKLVC